MLTELTPDSLPKGRRPQNRSQKCKRGNWCPASALCLLAVVRFLSRSCLALGRVWFWPRVSVLFCSASWVSTSISKSDGRRPQNRALLAGKPRNVDAVAGTVLGIPDFLLPYSTLEMMWTMGSAVVDDKIVVLGIVALLWALGLFQSRLRRRAHQGQRSAPVANLHGSS